MYIRLFISIYTCLGSCPFGTRTAYLNELLSVGPERALSELSLVAIAWAYVRANFCRTCFARPSAGLSSPLIFR